MIFNGVKQKDYDPSSDDYWWRMYVGEHPMWMPTISCLKELLLISGFLPLLETVSIYDQPDSHGINLDDPNTTYKRCRIALVAKAVSVGNMTKEIRQHILKK
jgi:hypothetical protein